MGNPILEIDLERVSQNASVILDLCTKNGIAPTAVVKGYNGIDGITQAIVEAGYQSLGSSRLPHLAAIRERGYPMRTLALRIPMQSEVAELVRVADVSLESEIETIRLVDDAAGKAGGKKHGVVLMRDVGDLREGIFDEELFIETACRVEKEFSHLYLEGIGTNLSCYGSVVPSNENLSQLTACAREIESRIGRKLDVVSGGGSTSLPLLLEPGKMPTGINHMRIGGAILLRSEFIGLPEGALPGLSDGTLTLRAEIIELGEKPTHPVGELGIDCFGNRRVYEDRGVRRRALLAVGAFDIGDSSKLVPHDPGVQVLGASSDHTIVDIHDSAENYRLGGTMTFSLLYQSMLFATGNALVKKRIVSPA